MHGLDHPLKDKGRNSGRVHPGRLVGLGVLAVSLLAPLPGLASAHGHHHTKHASGRPHSTSRPAISSVKPPGTILRSDLSLTGTVAKGTTSSVLKLSLDGSVPILETITAKTTLMVGPYAVGAAFLTPGTTVQTWTHIGPHGDIVADYVSLRPTVVQGSREAGALTDGANGQKLLTITGANGPLTLVVIPGDTVVHVIPPWDRSQGLSVTTQVAAVGVMLANGDLLSAEVLGIAASGQ